MINKLTSTFFVLLTTLVLIELVGALLGDNGYYWESRLLFISKDRLRSLGEDLWTYSPDSEVRYAATYHLSEHLSWVEYDCKFQTNAFGLIDTNFDPASRKADVLVVGDSFTEGHGGCPWLTRATLAKDAPTVINGGLQGTGIQSFERLEGWLASQVTIDGLVVVAISNDFKRMPSDFAGNRNECSVRGICEESDGWWGIDTELNADDLMLLADSRFRKLHRPRDMQLESLGRYYSSLYRLYRRYDHLITDAEAAELLAAANKRFEDNFAALERLRERHPRMRLLLVPQRDEVGPLGIENADTQFVRSYLDARNIQYSICNLSIHDYMQIDGHPNKVGYNKLFDCVSREIRAVVDDI